MYSELFMRPTGFLLLVSGWGIVLAAFAMLKAPVPQACFVVAGAAVELLGFALVVRSHGFVRRKKT